MSQSKISLSDFNEWLELPVTKELVALFAREENSHRTIVGSGGLFRAVEAGKLTTDQAVVAGAKHTAIADTFNLLQNGLEYDQVVPEDKREPVPVTE